MTMFGVITPCLAPREAVFRLATPRYRLSVLFAMHEPLLTRLSGRFHLVVCCFRVRDSAQAREVDSVSSSVITLRLTSVTDINMPGSMDGLRLAVAVKDRWPPINIIIATGKGAPRKDEMPTDSRFLLKPYSPDGVLAAIRHFQ
jgi:two-component system, response regulator PdtaR